MTHYEILQISETASPEIIRAAYTALAKKHHPDLNRDNLAQAEEMMKQINAAYETLSDPSKRRDYDLQLRINRSNQTSRQSSYQYTQSQSNHSQTYSNANTSQHSQYQSNSYQNSQHQSNSKSYTPPKTTNQSPSRIKKQLVKVLIWILCALGYGLLMATFNVLGVTLGGLPTVALAGGTILLAKTSCKKWDEHWSKKHTSSQKESQPPKKEKNKTWLWALLLTVFVISTIAVPLCIYYYSTNTSLPHTEPFSGKIFEGISVKESEITVVAPENYACVVTLKDATENTVLSFYMRAGDTVTIGVPQKLLYASFAMGKTWYDEKNLFGKETIYQKDANGRNFGKHTYKYTVYTKYAPSVVVVNTLNKNTQPTTGTILEGSEQYNASSVTVIAPENESCVVTIKDIRQKTVVKFYVRANEIATIGVPCEILYASFAIGTTWQDVNSFFGKDTIYQKDIGGRDFDNQCYKYSVHANKVPSVEKYTLGANTQTPTQSTTQKTPTLTPVSQPITGTILEGYEHHNASEITVTASNSESCVVKLKRGLGGGHDVLSFYVRAGETATVGVPSEYLYVYFASGKTWYGKGRLFGENTSYFKDDDYLDFRNYAWSYTLYPVTDGNFTETPIDADEFFD